MTGNTLPPGFRCSWHKESVAKVYHDDHGYLGSISANIVCWTARRDSRRMKYAVRSFDRFEEGLEWLKNQA